MAINATPRAISMVLILLDTLDESDIVGSGIVVLDMFSLSTDVCQRNSIESEKIEMQ